MEEIQRARSPTGGPWRRDREEELKALTERLRGWIAGGIEPHAIGVAARSAYLAKQAREALESAGIATARLGAKGKKNAVRAGTMHERMLLPRYELPG